MSDKSMNSANTQADGLESNASATVVNNKRNAVHAPENVENNKKFKDDIPTDHSVVPGAESSADLESTTPLEPSDKQKNGWTRLVLIMKGGYLDMYKKWSEHSKVKEIPEQMTQFIATYLSNENITSLEQYNEIRSALFRFPTEIGKLENCQTTEESEMQLLVLARDLMESNIFYWRFIAADVSKEDEVELRRARDYIVAARLVLEKSGKKQKSFWMEKIFG